MHLPLADNLKPERTRHRLPERTPAGLGLYAEQEGQMERLFGVRDVWRTEVRIGAQTAIDTRMPTERVERIHMETKGLIMRHVYGPVYDELIKVVHDLYDAGLYGNDPAVERLNGMIDTLGNSFRGYC